MGRCLWSAVLLHTVRELRLKAAVLGSVSLTKITISPASKAIAKGTELQLSATGFFSDGTQRNLSSSVTWKVSPAAVASINAQGELTGLTQGIAQVSATHQGSMGTASITIGPPTLLSIAVNSSQSTLPAGESEPLSASGSYTDGTVQDVTQSVVWQASPPDVASITARGVLKALSTGAVLVSAAYQSVTGSASVTVGPAALLSMAVSAPQASLPLGESEALVATGSYSDRTTQALTQSAAWVSSSPAIASVTSTGVLQGKGVGTATISATAGSITGVASLTISPPVIVGVTITPAKVALPLGGTSQFQGIAAFSDGTAKNMTGNAKWTSDEPGIAQISSTGLATAEHPGSVTIVASVNGLTGSSSLTVRPLLLVSYFNRTNAAQSGYDGTVRLANPGFPPDDLCAMVYVFDQSKELTECCGCKISDSGLLSLSLIKDLTSNPLTSNQPAAGTIEILPSDPGEAGQCNAGSLIPNGLIAGWQTNIQSSVSGFEITEMPNAISPLSDVEAEVLAINCGVVQQLGGGAGICSCGTGY